MRNIRFSLAISGIASTTIRIEISAAQPRF